MCIRGDDRLNKKILCLCFVLIALIGISGISACAADNSTVELSNSESCMVDSVQSIDNGFELDDQALADEDNFDSERGIASDLNENLSEDDCTSISNEDDDPVDDVDEIEIDWKDNGFIINAATDSPIENQSTFIPNIKEKNLFALDFDPATGIMKVNPNCSYMHSDYINSTDLKWYVKVDDLDYMKKYDCHVYEAEIGDGYPTRISEEFNLTQFLTICRLPEYLTEGHFTCRITIDVLGAKDFSIDFVFPIVVDEDNNIKYYELEKSVAHISGKNIKIYHKYDSLMSVFGPLTSKMIVKEIINEQKKASK